jgi:hypothetical protein
MKACEQFGDHESTDYKPMINSLTRCQKEVRTWDLSYLERQVSAAAAISRPISHWRRKTILVVAA